MKSKLYKQGQGVVIDKNVVIGRNVSIYHHSVIRNGCKICDDVLIGHHCVIEEDCVILSRTRIQAKVYLAKNTIVHSDVFIGPGVITTNDHDILSHGRYPNPRLIGPTIKKYARIGAGSIILPGVVIGENALVGAGSLVTKDIPAGEVWYGSPAKFIERVKQEHLL